MKDEHDDNDVDEGKDDDAVRSKRSSIEDLVLMRTKLPKLSSFSPHFIQKTSSSPILIYLGT